MTRDEALAYFTPHPLTKGPVMLDPEKMREAVAVLGEGIAEAARYKTCLELDHCYDLNGDAIPWPEGMTPIDGIACRDETIKGQDDQIEALVKERDAYREALSWIADEEPATQEMTMLHIVCQHARETLSQLSRRQDAPAE